MKRNFRLALLSLLFASTSALAADPGFLTLDTHLDTPFHFGRAGWDIAQRHSKATDLTQVDYPRMVEGGLSGGFFAIYTEQGPETAEGFAAARDAALLRAVQIREMVAKHADKFALAFKADDAARIRRAGKRVVFQSMENSSPLGEDLTLLRTFYDLGVRMAGPVHLKSNVFGDSATDKPRWNGLSPLGLRWVEEMNRLGLVIDASHASDDVFDQLLARSKTPIILSHSGCRAVFDHPRNLDDERLRRLAASGGVIQINTFYVAPPPPRTPERKALDAKLETITQLSPAEQKKLAADFHALDLRDGAPRGTFEQFVQHLLHAIEVAGVDHVGIGADWDGGGGVAGMDDVTALPKITAALRKAGYADADIQKIWSGNVLRVLRQVETHAGRH